jgi:hypothetical protein
MNGLHLYYNLLRLAAHGKRMLVLGACLVAAGMTARAATGTTLQDLFNGGSINVGNSQFSDWQLTSLDSTAAVNSLLSQIVVNPLGSDPSNPSLQFVANGQLSTSGINSIDLTFAFRIHAIPGGNAFNNHSLALPEIRFGGNSGLGFVSDEVTDSSDDDLGPALVIADMGSNFSQLNDTLDFAPQSAVFVSTNIFVRGLSPADAISLTSFTLGFSQTGPAILPGDYNQDGIVDTSDYVVWRDHVGQPAGSLPNDVDGGPIGQAQFDTWLAKFGNASSAPAALQHAAVPEAASWLLLTLAAAGLSLPWRRQCSRDHNRFEPAKPLDYLL